MALLVAADRVDFRFIRDTVEVSDSALSQHVTALEKAGYVTVVKGQFARRPRTWLSSTALGREAFTRHVDALQRIAQSALHAPESTPLP
jgi:DNA-binding MarR family transcriptional regulator